MVKFGENKESDRALLESARRLGQAALHSGRASAETAEKLRDQLVLIGREIDRRK